jgi:predicted  nucleic acid-binding Zn-ribbon protein
MSVAKQLYQLQEIDLDLESGKQAVARIVSRVGESQALASARDEFAREQERLEELRRRQHSAEWEVDDLTTRLVAVDEKLYGGRIRNPKELTSLQQEADSFRAKRGQAEDKALEVMELVSEKEERVAVLGGELGRLEGQWKLAQQQLLDEAERYKKAIAETEQRRLMLVAEIEPSAVDVYQEIKKKRDRPVARVEQGTCRGCGISLSTAQLQQTKSDRMVHCSNCGRILFFA